MKTTIRTATNPTGPSANTEPVSTPAIDADSLPLISDTAYFGKLLGWGPTYVARLCQQGKIPTATKVGKSWRINVREALRGMGLLHDQPAK